MTAGLSTLPIRSSPAYRHVQRRVAVSAYAHTSSQSSIPSSTDSMLARANKDHEAKAPPPRAPLAKQLFPSSSPCAPSGDIRDQFQKPGWTGYSANASSPSARTVSADTKPLNDRSANITTVSPHWNTGKRSLVSLYSNATSAFKHDTGVIDLTLSDHQAKIKDTVFFAEDDFSDDDNLDLDYEAPSAFPVLPPSKPPSKDTMLVLPPASQTEASIPWSSSPASHFIPPKPERAKSSLSSTSNSNLKRESSGENFPQDVPMPKKVKRVLPASFMGATAKQEVNLDGIHKTPVAHKSKDVWDPSASAVKEQKKQLKNQRRVDPIEEQRPEFGKSHTTKNDAISLSGEQEHVLDLVVNQNKSAFFTGPAGTGKSVLMRAIIARLRTKHSREPDRVAVTASTGLAACNIGGVTLHSFSGIGLGKEDAQALVKKIRRNPKAKNRWLRTKCLIIDEISMVDGELFDKLDRIGRTIRNNGRPWGGIQLILTGDFFQLPPVPDADKNRDVKFAFDASTWGTSIDHTIGLTQVFRQRDPQFAQMLNEMRLGKISQATVDAFKALSRPLKFDDGVDSAELFPTRAQVEGSNERRLRELPGMARRYDAMDTGDQAIRDKLLANMMAPKSLELKVNSQVMLIKNLDETLVNGSLGKVIAFSDERTFDLESGVTYDDDVTDPLAKARKKLKEFSHVTDSSSASAQKFPVVQFISTGGVPRVILCQPEEWKVELPNGEVQAKRSQLPLILAWALSIHKAQGQTLERVTVNLGKVFEKGQAYVALSRATTQDGLRVLGFDKSKVMAHPRVVQFYSQLYSVEQALGMKPASVTDFVNNRKGVPKSAAARKISEVVEMDDDEEAMASYGY